MNARGPPAATGARPEQPQGRDRHEVEGELPCEGREAPEEAGDRGHAARAARVGRERPLDGTPQEKQVHRLRPVVRGVPDELGVERGRGRGEKARPAPEGESAGPAHDGDEQGPEEDLGPQDGLHRAEGTEERADEIRVDRGIEDEVAPERRERHCRPRDPPAQLDPAGLVAGQGAERLERQVGGPDEEGGQGEEGEGSPGRGLRRGRIRQGLAHGNPRDSSPNDSALPSRRAATIPGITRRQHGGAGGRGRGGGQAAAGAPHAPAHRDRVALPLRGPREVLLGQLDLGRLPRGLALDLRGCLPVDGVAPRRDRPRGRGEHRRPDPDRAPADHGDAHPRGEPRRDRAAAPLLPRQPAARGPRARHPRRRPLPRRGPEPDRAADPRVPRGPAGDGTSRGRPLVRAPPAGGPRGGARGRGRPGRTRSPRPPRSR